MPLPVPHNHKTQNEITKELCTSNSKLVLKFVRFNVTVVNQFSESQIDQAITNSLITHYTATTATDK